MMKAKVVKSVNKKFNLTNPKEGQDYVEIKGEKFYSTFFLKAKYGCSDWHLIHKAKDNNIEKLDILGRAWYKDDPTVFEKKGGRDNKHGIGKPNVTYVELRNSVDDLMEQVRDLIGKIGAEGLFDALEENNKALNDILDKLSKNEKLEERVNDLTVQVNNMNAIVNKEQKMIETFNDKGKVKA